MTAQLYHHPIPNSQYAHPGRHWEFDADGHHAGALWARAIHTISSRTAGNGSAKSLFNVSNATVKRTVAAYAVEARAA